MSDIIATNPVVVPPVPGATFDRWVIPSLVVSWPSVDGPMTLEAWFQSARRDAAGKLITGDARTNYFVADLWALAATDPAVAGALNQLIGVLTAKAKAAGVI